MLSHHQVTLSWKLFCRCRGFTESSCTCLQILVVSLAALSFLQTWANSAPQTWHDRTACFRRLCHWCFPRYQLTQPHYVSLEAPSHLVTSRLVIIHSIPTTACCFVHTDASKRDSLLIKPHRCSPSCTNILFLMRRLFSASAHIVSALHIEQTPSKHPVKMGTHLHLADVPSLRTMVVN